MSDKICRLLAGITAPGVYRTPERASTAIVAQQARLCGWRLFHLDGQQVASKEDLLQCCATVMRFPSYFGRNWDALEDSLRDLSWAPTQAGYLLLFDHAARFAHAAPADFAVALDIFRSAIEFWRPTPTPLAVVLRGLGDAGAQVPRL
jgi:hypothetical protein